MKSQRYLVHHESGNDWSIYDSLFCMNTSTGLDRKEAEDTAENWNKLEENKKKLFIEKT